VENEKYNQLTTFNGQDLLPQWADNETIYFQSARSGKYNIHKLKIDNSGKKQGEISQISSLKRMGIDSFDLSENGKDIVLVSGDNVSLLKLGSNALTPISISINSDYRFDPVVRKTYSSNATEISISPNAKYTAIVVRGEIFITENDTKKSRAVNVSSSPYRDINVVWLNNETLLFISDRDGSNNIYTVTSGDVDNKNLFSSLKHTVKQITKSKEGITNIIVAPNKKRVVYNKGNDKLVIADISNEGKITNEKTLTKGWSAPSNVAWSPDSKWLSYNLSDLNFNSEVYIHKADNTQKPVNISMHPKTDFGAIWSKDGSKIAFSSNRNNGDYDIWFVWLRKTDWEKTQQDWEEEDTDEKPNADEKKKEAKKEVSIQIDFENIHERQQQVTSFTGGEFLTSISADGKTFYYTTGNGTRGNPSTTSDLHKISWEGKDKKELTKGDARPQNIFLTSKEDNLYFISKGKVARIALKSSKKENIPFSAKMKINYVEESNQIFEEAWKVIQGRFYDPQHHGQNWTELKSIYKPLALKASTRTDFKAIFNKEQERGVGSAQCSA